ncbi:hypothetical protein [Microbacterium sp. CFBP9034]|uniref:hypothetical protein n=1 Tax=Microbacterium sp. CFBP9034 TaxID=3096540 RepID=UPI002A6B0D9B|nr:hypothetical protein [Microbacterium sp. CFBP9034]MDY0910902.1 hypothetical protein [Microbacterium sp. CFBP9034]
MKALTNRVGTFLTGDEIADAVMEYSGALAQEHRTEVVELPFITGSGDVGHVKMLIGWQSDVTAIREGHHHREMVDDELADALRRSAATVRGPSGDTPFSARDLESLVDECEF